MMAIFDRERTGVGRWVTTSLLEAQIFMLDFQASRWLMAKEVAPQAGNDHPTGIPTGVFPTSDGHINIAASSGRVFGRFCEAIGKPEWKDKREWKDQKSRSGHRKEINAAIGEVTRHKPSEYWIELLEGAGVPCGPIYTIDQVFADPQVQHLGMATPMHSPEVGDVEVVASAISMTGFYKAHPPADAGDEVEHRRSAGVGRLQRRRDLPRCARRERFEMNDMPSGGITREYAGGKMLAAKDEGVGLITFNQPEKRNAMSLEMWTGLGEILDEFAADNSVRVVILSGAGNKAFVSGADISQFEKNRARCQRAAGI